MMWLVRLKTLIMNNVVLPENMRSAFSTFRSLESISLNGVDSSNVKNMQTNA